MKHTQLEILLFTDTRFSSKQICGKYDVTSQNNSSKNKGLEEACWDGLFHGMLRELSGRAQNAKKLILWKITEAEHFLEFEYGDQPAIKDKDFSANPYFFLGSHLLS